MTTIKNDAGCDILICPECVKVMKEEGKTYDFGNGDRSNHYHCKNLYKAKDKNWGEYAQCNMSFKEDHN